MTIATSPYLNAILRSEEEAARIRYLATVADGYHPRTMPIPPQRQRAATEQPDPLSPATRPCL